VTKATIDTDKGVIEIELSTTGAPKAAANFIELANKGYFDGVVFHRLVPGFVIQGGDGEYGHIDKLDRGRLGTGGPGYRFEDEPFEGDYVRGAVAMANAGPNTNGSQFFICLDDLSGGRLPKKYTIFGTVASGMDAVDTIAAAKRDGRDQPNEPTAMLSVKISE
jgi:cyclophilin family peptidyl-prolyl cis-trans isomerase